MTYKTFLDLPLSVREALMFHYSLQELDFYKISRRPEEVTNYLSAAALKEEKALEWGRRLTSSIFMMFTADSSFDYTRDCESYLKVATAINHIYGDIVAIPENNERVSSMFGYGIKGHLKIPFSSVETMEIIDGVTVFRTEDYAERLFYINENYRAVL